MISIPARYARLLIYTSSYFRFPPPHVFLSICEEPLQSQVNKSFSTETAQLWDSLKTAFLQGTELPHGRLWLCNLSHDVTALRSQLSAHRCLFVPRTDWLIFWGQRECVSASLCTLLWTTLFVFQRQRVLVFGFALLWKYRDFLLCFQAVVSSCNQ